MLHSLVAGDYTFQFLVPIGVGKWLDPLQIIDHPLPVFSLQLDVPQFVLVVGVNRHPVDQVLASVHLVGVEVMGGHILSQFLLHIHVVRGLSFG